VRAMIEFAIAFWYINPPAFVAYAFAILCLAAVRSIYYEYIDTMSMFFIIMYCSLNFIVNSIDFIYFRKSLGFYDDWVFHLMFSYKVFLILLCIIVSFVFSQSIKPTFATLKEHPVLLSTIFNLTIPTNIAMLCCFLYELTVYDQMDRRNIYQTQLFKVVATNISVYLIAIFYSYWI